jgi:cell division protease FtsH
MFCDDISSGAQNDIQTATNIAKQMVQVWGMSDELGLINYSPDLGMANLGYPIPGEKEYSDKTAEMIDTEVKKITCEAQRKATDLIHENKDKLEKIAKALLKYETLDADDVKLILEGGTIDKPTVADLLAAEQAKNHHSEQKEEEKKE